MSFVVVCQDGYQRHSGRFETRDEAQSWAWWGHVCTASHRIVDPDMTESELVHRWRETE